MQKLVLFLILMATAAMGHAQTKPKTPVKPKPVAQQPTLKTLNDSVSYAIGANVASFYKQQGITTLNSNLVAKAISDILGNKQALMDENACQTAIIQFINKQGEEKAKPNIEQGKAFLAKNKTRPEVKTTASGLQYEIITQGTGIKPTAADTFVCHYRGSLINGSEFDASYNRGEPLELPVTSVIPGWTEGLQLMPVGSKYKFYIPYTLAYGTQDRGPALPAGSTLIFEVELLDVKKGN